MYPVQMPFFMYLIFSKKAENTIFLPTGWVWRKNVHPDRIKFCESLSLLFLRYRETGLAELAYADLFQMFCAFLAVVGTGFFICRKCFHPLADCSFLAATAENSET